MDKKKKWAVILCMAVTIIIAVPVCLKIYFERMRYIEPISTNIYEYDFVHQWQKITNALQLDEHDIETARIEDLNVYYKISGEIKNMNYQITWKENEQFYHAFISYNESRGNIAVKANKISKWLQYDSMLQVNSLFSRLDQVNIKEITSKNKEYSYYGFSIGTWDSLTTNPDGEVFAIKDNSIISIKGNAPVKGNWIRSYCMEQYAPNAYSSTMNKYYLLNLQ